MTKYHVNPSTGRAGQCKAMSNCPFGDLETDHYLTKEEANVAYESSMTNQTVPKRVKKNSNKLVNPILISPSKMKLRSGTNMLYFVEYDYDGYHCSDPYECSNGDDYCRDSVYEGLRITQWTPSEGLDAYVKGKLGLQERDPIPKKLKDKLKSYYNIDDIVDDFYIRGEPGYYGEEVEIDGPESLEREIKDYYYSLPNAIDPNGILPYLRGKGFDTTNKRPLQAIKESLRVENGGRISKRVESAKSFKTASIGVRNIIRPSKSQSSHAKNNPRPLTPEPATGNKDEIAGVVFKRDHGKYELIDGYHRTATLDALNTTGKKRGKYIILSASENKPHYYLYSRHGIDYSWSQE